MNLRLVPLLAIVVGMVASTTSAATLTINGNGILTGATSVDVGGSLYDVNFVDTSCIVLFTGCDQPSDFDFTTGAAADAASQALFTQVFVDGPGGNFDSNPFLTFGCGAETRCDVWTPYTPSSATSFLASVATNTLNSDLVDIGEESNNLDFGQANVLVMADWTPASAPVPEPASLTLLGLGLAGLGARRWRQRKT